MTEAAFDGRATDARLPARHGRPVRVAMLVHAYYEEDAHVRREAEALVAAGYEVDVYGLQAEGQPETATIEGVRVRRLPVRRHQGAGIVTYFVEYGEFLLRSMFAATRAQPRRRYRLVQVHSLPDYLVAAALPLKLDGVPVLLDLHEAMPEFFKTRFPKAANPLSYGLLRLAEWLSTRPLFATHVLTVNEPFAERLRREARVPDDRLTVIFNSPDTRLFDPAPYPVRPFMADGLLRIVYAGALTPTYELDVVLHALAIVHLRRPELAFVLTVYGRGDSEPALRALAASLGIADCVTFAGRVPIEAVPGAVAASDVGLAPTRLNSFTEMTLSTKVLEYGALGKPVVASRLPSVARYFGPETLYTYDPGDPEDLAAQLTALVDEPEAREAHVLASARRIAELSWPRQAAVYRGVVASLTTRRPDRMR